MLRQIVVNDQHVTALFHEIFGDAGGRIGRNIREAGRVVAFGDDNHGIVHRPFFAKVRDDLGDGGCPLADGAINADHIFPTLVQNAVQGNGRLARLAIAQDQFALAAPNGDKGINDHESSLERDCDRRSVHDSRRRAFDRQALAGGHWPFAIEGLAERVNDTAQQFIADGHIHHPPRAFDLITGVKILISAEQHYADFIFVHVEGDAEHIAGKFYQLFKTHAGKTGDFGDASGDTDDRAHLPQPHLWRKAFQHLANPGKSAVEDALQAFRSGVHQAFNTGSSSPSFTSTLALGLRSFAVAGLG